MPSWLHSREKPFPVKKWADEVNGEPYIEAPNLKARFPPQKKQQNMSLTASTDVEETLPVPVLQSKSKESCMSSNRRRKRSTSIFKRLWTHFKHHAGSGTAPSTNSVNEQTVADVPQTTRAYHDLRPDDSELDEVVVDRDWSEQFHTTISHHSDEEEEEDTSDKSKSRMNTSGKADSDSSSDEDPVLSTFEAIAFRVQHAFMEVFSSRFADDLKEYHYLREDWYVKKSLAIVTSLWWICNWVLGAIFVRLTDSMPGGGPMYLSDKIFYWGLAPALSVPVVFMVMYDWPRERQYLYQAFLIVSIWCWPFYHVILINVCGYYQNDRNCRGREFMATFYYATALQVIGFFGLKLNRFPAALGALAYLLLASISIIPDQRTWARSMINFFVFHGFLIYVHYIREKSERRLYTLRDQLKNQFKETQRAQNNERKASDSKRRLTSYVRVPLNTALLAVQNMEASETVAKDQEIEFSALSGSLKMMSKVLNDVLDFNRMDSGKFELASRPYHFHQVMRSLFIPLRLATDARQLAFESYLDPKIDQVARALAYEATGESPEHIREHMKKYPDVGGIVIGDEDRLRQIITNLAGNACKFTPPGGKLTIRTKLIQPVMLDDEDPLDYLFPSDKNKREEDKCEEHDLGFGPAAQRPLSAEHLHRHNCDTRHGHDKVPLETIAVRIEITDTGYGIRAADFANNNLFSAFNQTERGIQQGGKGTGLGLALVRQIIKLTGGRLGVKSKIDQGTTFWVELPLGVGLDTLPATGSGNTPNRNNGPHVGFSNSAPRSLERYNELAKGLDDANAQNLPDTLAVENAVYAAAALQHDANTHGPSFTRPGSSSGQKSQRHSRQEAKRELEKKDSRVALLKSDQEEVDVTDAGGMSGSSGKNSKRNSRSKPWDELLTVNGGEGEPASNANGEAAEPDTVKTISSSGPRPVGLPPTQQVEPNPVREASSRANPPKFVALPRPPVFAEGKLLEPQPVATSSSFTSEVSSSSLTAFDNAFAHCGSPSSSSANVNVVKGLNVLVVDDDPVTRMLMSRILTRLGCQVTTAENGEMAVDLILGRKGWSGLTPSSDTSKLSGPILEQPRPDDIAALGPVPDELRFAVVFLDNQMPVMSGLRAVSRLRQLGRKDFVVGVTGNALLTDQREYLDAGVDRVLTKPVLERSLREMLANAAERRKPPSTIEEDHSSAPPDPPSSTS